MKIAITSEGNQLNSSFDLRFGRAAYFCLFDDETRQTEFVKNEFAQAQGGAGTKAASTMVERGVKKVVSGDFGPKAKDLLDKFGIQMIIMPNGHETVANILEKMK
jgi:predicted Fe-Mo cluster-binding NifX family protein